MAVARRTTGKYTLRVDDLTRDADRDQIVDYLEFSGFKKLMNNGVPLPSSDCFDSGYKLWYQCGTYEDNGPLTHWVEFGNKMYNYIVRTTQVGNYERYMRSDAKNHCLKIFSTFEDMIRNAKKRNRTAMRHLTEAVASRRTGKYDVWDTKDGITDYLEKMGFKCVHCETYFDLLDESNNLGGKPVYCIGDYTSDPTTHWIKFYSPKWKDRVFFCRENDIIPRVEDRTTSKWSILVGGSWNDIHTFEEFRAVVKDKIGI